MDATWPVDCELTLEGKHCCQCHAPDLSVHPHAAGRVLGTLGQK